MREYHESETGDAHKGCQGRSRLEQMHPGTGPEPEAEASSCPVCAGMTSTGTTAGRYTQQLAEFVARLSFEDLPPEVVEKAKGALFDFLGAAFAGSTRPHARRAVDVVLPLVRHRVRC